MYNCLGRREAHLNYRYMHIYFDSHLRDTLPERRPTQINLLCDSLRWLWQLLKLYNSDVFTGTITARSE